MKNSLRFLQIAFCIQLLVVSIQSHGQKGNIPRILSYVESSTGLGNPEWEGGRTELEFADMNYDGNLDIISIGDHGNPGIQSGEQGLMVFLGDGHGNWSVQMTGDFGYGGIAAGDVNNDGLMDVGYAMHHNYSGTDFGDQLIEVALGDGTGVNWTPWDDGLATNGEDWGMFSTDFADVDNDGDLDLGSISFGCCAGLHVYLNHMNGTWTQSWGVLEGNSDMIFQFGDINNDGSMDFVAGYQNGTAYFGDEEGGFTLNDQGLPAGGSLGRYGPSLGDVDGDGGMDLAFSNSNGGLFVYAFIELMNSWVNISGNLPASGPYEHTQLADMDMDGFIDLAAFGNGTFRLFLGDGAGNWTADATFTANDPGYSQAFRVGGDLDHNGRPDIVLLNEKELSWFTYQNILRCYKESSVAVLLGIQAVYPRGHELFRPGSVRFIDWVSNVPGNDPAQVTLEYSTSGPEGPWTLISGQLPNNGRYQWTVPQENSSNCYIRYSIDDGVNTFANVTPQAFVITDGTIGIGEQGSMEESGQGSLEVWPNPASEGLSVEVSGLSSGMDCSLVLYDILGRIAPAPSLAPSPKFGEGRGGGQTWQVDVSTLPPGIYVLKMISEEGYVATAKFLKVDN
jgi:hypothetical protein